MCLRGERRGRAYEQGCEEYRGFEGSRFHASGEAVAVVPAAAACKTGEDKSSDPNQDNGRGWFRYRCANYEHDVLVIAGQSQRHFVPAQYAGEIGAEGADDGLARIEQGVFAGAKFVEKIERKAVESKLAGTDVERAAGEHDFVACLDGREIEMECL